MSAFLSVPRYRVRPGDIVAGFVASSVAMTLRASFRVLYDDGENDEFTIPDFTTGAAFASQLLQSDNRAKKDGYVVSGVVIVVSTIPLYGQTYVALWTARAAEGVNVKDQLIGDWLYNLHTPSLGNIVGPNMGPGVWGPTWVFQGTVLEDATAGTHVSSLTVSPGAGNEMQLMYAHVLAGNGAANLTSALIDDGTNTLAEYLTNTSLAANEFLTIPSNTITGATKQMLSEGQGAIISGTMRLKISVSTATVSLTHAFACVCRIKSAIPTATLADSVGVPTLTTNTNAVF